MRGDVAPVVLGASPPELDGELTVRLETGKRSALGIGAYPPFRYNASGGGGLAAAPARVDGSRVRLAFEPVSVRIPAVTWRSARFLGAPLPPVFRIDVAASRLEGWVDLQTGEAELMLHAAFHFSAAGLYHAPPMHVQTRLTTETVSSKHHHRQGRRLGSDGGLVLVGVGDVTKTGHRLLDWFLRLPTDVLGLMTARLCWHRPPPSAAAAAPSPAPRECAASAHLALREAS